MTRELATVTSLYFLSQRLLGSKTDGRRIRISSTSNTNCTAITNFALRRLRQADGGSRRIQKWRDDSSKPFVWPSTLSMHCHISSLICSHCRNRGRRGSRWNVPSKTITYGIKPFKVSGREHSSRILSVSLWRTLRSHISSKRSGEESIFRGH